MSIAPNGMQILDRLGLAHEVVSQGNVVHSGFITDSKGRSISTLKNTDFSRKFGWGPVAIHRASLQQILLKQLPAEKVLPGKKFLRYIEHADRIEAHFEDGSVYEGDILVGADGIRSGVRNQLLGGIPLRYSGQTCWRGIADMQLPEEEKQVLKEVWMNKAGLRAAYAQISERQVYWYVTICAEPDGHEENSKTKAYLKDLTKDAAGLIHQVIDHTDDSHILRSDLNDFEPIHNWSKGRVVLMGDAAHATTPNLGQGANQAMESAYCLAESLAVCPEIGEAFLRYENMRRPKAHLVTKRSWQFGKMSSFSSPLMMYLVKTAVRLSPKSATMREFEKIYTLNY
jgi:2-polyprenyl-6-methoxyphenol hydroxylase-like FAD-dependent oxidoreductase